MLQSIPAHVTDRLVRNETKKRKVPYYLPDEDGHWIWQGHTGRTSGYGWIGWMVDGRETGMNAHRAVYIAFKGPIPREYDVDHECRVNACVNFDHMEPVTTSINLKRGVLARFYLNGEKTHCPAGHPYDEANTRHHKGTRSCRECERVKGREAYARKMGRPLRVYHRTAPYK